MNCAERLFVTAVIKTKKQNTRETKIIKKQK